MKVQRKLLLKMAYHWVLLPLVLPLLLVYAAVAAVAVAVVYVATRPVPSLRRRLTLGRLARKPLLLLFIGPWAPGE